MLWEPARTIILFKFNNGSLLESTNFIKTIKISSSCKLLQKHSIVTTYFTVNARFKIQIKGGTHYLLKGRYQNIIISALAGMASYERSQGDFEVRCGYILKNLCQIPIAARKILSCLLENNLHLYGRCCQFSSCVFSRLLVLVRNIIPSLLHKWALVEFFPEILVSKGCESRCIWISQVEYVASWYMGKD